MKRTLSTLALIVLVLSGGIWRMIPTAQAQDGSDLITLNDASPGIDVVVSPAPGTSGVVAVQIESASVQVTDGSGALVFQMADARVHGLELRFAPDSGTHTVTIERLPGVSEAYVRVLAQSDLTDSGSGTLVTTNSLSDQQQVDIPLTNAVPSSTVNVSVPTGLTDAVTASFPGASVTAQLVDNSGVAVASLYSSRIDGISLMMESGEYALSLLNTSPAQNTVANVSVQPVSDLLDESAVMVSDPAPTTNAASTSNCTATLLVSSVNLRTGPGPGYSVSGYGFRGDELLVGGTNTDGSWLLVGTETGAAWMVGNTAQLNNQCANLTTYDIPYRDAPAPQIVVQQTGSFFDDEDEDEHEEHDDDEHEDEDDDD